MVPHATKARAILEVLNRLENALGADQFQVVDHWQADQCAVGIGSPRDPGLLVYIAVSRHAPGRFFYECELPRAAAGPDELPYAVVEQRDDVGIDELAGVVRSHFDREDRRS
jgi:hypothetical protein